MQVRQIAPDFWEMMTPGGARYYIEKIGGYFKFGSKEYTNLNWAQKAVERYVAERPNRDRPMNSVEATIDDITLRETPKGYAVNVGNRGVRVYLTNKGGDNYEVSAGMSSGWTVRGLDNAKAKAVIVFNGAVGAFGDEVWSGTDANGVFQYEGTRMLDRNQVRKIVSEVVKNI